MREVTALLTAGEEPRGKEPLSVPPHTVIHKIGRERNECGRKNKVSLQNYLSFYIYRIYQIRTYHRVITLQHLANI